MAELPQFTASATLRTLWQARVGSSAQAVLSPAVFLGHAYAAGEAGSIAKVDLATGRTVWNINAGTRISGGVGSDGRLVAVGSPEGEITAVESATGAVRWRARVSSEVLAAPVFAGDLVVVRSVDSRVFGLDAKDGRRRWVYQRSASPLSVRSPAGLVIANGHAYGGFSGGKLVAIALSNGGVRWEATVALPKGSNELDRVTDVIGLPWVSEREVCAVAFQGRVACFELGNGNLLWAREMSSVSGLSADSGRVFLSDDRGAVHALDRSTGTSVWKQDRLFRRGLTAPVPLGKHVFVADVQGYIHVLNRDNGAFEARTATDGSAIASTPIAIDRIVLSQTKGGNLIAVGLQ